MTVWRTLWRREIRGWLLQPGHYVMAAAFLAASGLGFWMLVLTGAGQGFQTSEVTFGGTVFWLAVTALTALSATRPLSEERERGTLELLLTAPVREREMVGAVYAGTLVWMVLVCLPAVCAPWLLLALAPGWAGVDGGAWAAGTLGLVAALAWLTAVGLLASVVCRRQTTAATITFLIGLLVLFGGALTEWAGSRGLLARVTLALHASHAGGFVDGFMDARALAFAAVVGGWCLFAAVRWLQWSRYRQMKGIANVAASLLLAAVLGGMILALSYRHPRRWDWSASRLRPVSEHTAQVLGGLTHPVRVTLVGPSDDPLTVAAWRVLERYPLATARIAVDRIDPDRELERARDLARQYGLDETAVAVVQARDRHRVVALRRVVAAGADVPAPGRSAATAGQLDAALAAAVYAVSRDTVPVVYFLTGHGERSVADFGDYSGFGEIATRIRDTQAEVRPVTLDAQAPLSNDCAALVVAGPSTGLSAWEVGRLRDYVLRGGRLMLLLDSGVGTGLEGLAAEWGVVAGVGRVVDRAEGDALPFSHARAAAAGLGEVHVAHYAAHPASAGLDGRVSTFYLPRPLETAGPAADSTNTTDQADRPRVALLAVSGPASWVECDPLQSPPQFDEGIDRRGPVGVAACVEKGAASPVRVDIRPTRLVVFGDSQFAANRCLVGANAALFLKALDWLLDQGDVVSAAASTRGQFDLQLARPQRRTAFALIVIVPPVLALACALGVAWLRRDRRVARGSDEGGRR